MNYLAHLYLADFGKSSLLGNLMGDFVKGRLQTHYPQAITHGIMLHRQIDKFTDSHPVFRLSRQRIDTSLARYSAVLIDVFYDHFLAANWQRYSDAGFDQQVERWARSLESDSDFPVCERLLQTVHAIRHHQLLHSYQTIEGVEFALLRLSHRIRFKTNLANGVHDLRNHYNALNRDFNAFFPDVLQFVSSLDNTATAP